MRKRVPIAVRFLAVVAAGGLGILTGVAVTSGATASEPALPSPTYSVNANGKTIGPWIGGKNAFQPDLVEIIADSGERGFAKTSDLMGEVAKSPDDAVRITKERVNASGDIVIPVYSEDGVTRIGQVTIGHVSELGDDGEQK